MTDRSQRPFGAHDRDGDLRAGEERWEEAVAAYRSALAADPLAAETHVKLGHALSRLNRWAEAAAAYGRGTELEPASAPTYTVLGRALAQSGAPAEAAVAFERAARLAPTSARQHDLGDALLRLGRFDEAADAFRQADTCNPDWSRRDPGAAAAAAGQWIDRLRARSTSARDATRRTLFVLDNDYGELTTAMYFLLGQDLAAGATLLLPPRLFVTNADVLPGRTFPYTSVDDVLRAVDAGPDVVVLCSAYLYALHGILDSEALAHIVHHCRHRGSRIVTTDPFLGLLSEDAGPALVTVDMPDEAPPWLRALKTIEDERLGRLLGAAEAIVAELPHLYPSCPPSVTDRLSFFNPDLRCDLPQAPLWLFVLSSRDYECQLMRHGRDGFAAVLARRFEDASHAGRHPVFVGPHDCVQAVIEYVDRGGGEGIGEARGGITLLTFCSFTRFSSLLLSAEYAFYWNALSHSMFLRLFNGLPVFLFDRGHLVRNAPPLYARIVEWYYQGWNPIYLDPDRDLRDADLGRLAEEYRRGAAETRARAARLPSPRQLIDHLAP